MPSERRKADKVKAPESESQTKRQRTELSDASTSDPTQQDGLSVKAAFIAWKKKRMGRLNRLDLYQWIIGLLDSIELSSHGKVEDVTALNTMLDRVYTNYKTSAEAQLTKILDLTKNAEPQTADSQRLREARKE